MDRLHQLGAPVLGGLLPGANDNEISAFEQKTGLTFPDALKEYWQTVGGISKGLTYHQSIFAGYLFGPVSLKESAEDYDLATDMRKQNPTDDQEFSDEFWPEGMVKFAGRRHEWVLGQLPRWFANLWRGVRPPYQ